MVDDNKKDTLLDKLNSELQSNFSLVKIKHFCEVKDGTHDTPSYVIPSKDSFPLVTSKNIVNGELDFSSSNHISEADYIQINRRSNVEKYDVLMPMIGTIGNPAIVYTNKKFSIKNIALFKMNGNREKSEFLKYLIESDLIQKQFNLLNRGGVQSFVSLNILKNLYIINDDFYKSIVLFLNKKTSEIDTLISDKEKLIALLEENRQALITEAITKGLDPEVKMKDSGVEWIGKIPEHWNTKKIKHLLNRWKSAIKTGPFGSHLSNKDMESDYKKVFNQKNVLKNNFDIGDYYVSKDKYEELKSFEIKQGDLLITTRGTIGKAAIVPEVKDTGILHPCLIKLDINDFHYNPKLLEIIFNDTSIIKEQVYVLSNSTTIEVIYSETLKNIFIPISPYLKEQDEIIKKVEEKKKNYLSLIDNITCQIQKLKEYRQALIYEAVTGKIDVQEMLKETEQEEVSSS